MRIAYVVDRLHWAIHAVGEQWQRVLGQSYDFNYLPISELHRYRPNDFDLTVWGYGRLYSNHVTRGRAIREPQRLLIVPRWRPQNAPDCVTILHDPCEITPTVEGWKDLSPEVGFLRRYGRVATTSNELIQILEQNDLNPWLIWTSSLMALRDLGSLHIEPLSAYVRVSGDIPRKNLAQARRVRERIAGTFSFDLIIGRGVLPLDEHVGRIDGYGCYVCTSVQEGGPLPVMDALRRGSVVLTRRVGQTDRLIEHGVNGFFCDTDDDFVGYLERLRDDPELLLRMRQAALISQAADTDSVIRAQLKAFLQGVRPSSHEVT